MSHFNQRNKKYARRKYSRFVWLFGFFGLLGFRYFFTHNVNDLFNFSFLAFFSVYFTAKLAAEMPDERYVENRLKAKAATLFVPAIALFILGIGMVAFDISPRTVLLIAALGWGITFITYALSFWYYEKQ